MVTQTDALLTRRMDPSLRWGDGGAETPVRPVMPAQAGIDAEQGTPRLVAGRFVGGMDPSLRWGDGHYRRNLSSCQRRLASMLTLSESQGMRGGWVYIMTDAPYGTLYIGVTASLPARVVQHREGKGSKFCRKYGLHRLVYCEPYERIDDAIAREKAMKAWHRRWKTKLIEKANPEWSDLSEHLLEASF